MICISLFDISGEMLKPWRDAGYECHLFDIQHPEGHTVKDGMHCHKIDLSAGFRVMKYIDQELIIDGDTSPIKFASMFPPCTHLAVSGARWMAGKGLRRLQESISYFATCSEVAAYLDCPYLIENPMSTISTYWREPDHKFHPCHYSGYVGGNEMFTKETWLWTGGGFVMPPRQMGSLIDPIMKKDDTMMGKGEQHDFVSMPDKTYIHHQPPGEERANIRSKTPAGFAKAVFEANCRPEDKTVEILADMHSAPGYRDFMETLGEIE